MYQIAFSPKRFKKEFIAIIEKDKDQDRHSKILESFQNYPKGNTTTHGIIEKKNNFWCYDLPRGKRITYKVYEIEFSKPTVIIYFIGNHNDYRIFLRKNAKKN